MESLNSVEAKLDFAEKLVFGYDNTEIDLRVGMHIIKTEASNKNPQAEFLMYKVNIQKGKIRAAMDWLKKSYKHHYPKALALVHMEFARENAKFIDEEESTNALKQALDLNVPEAYFIMSLIYEEDKIKFEAYIRKAQEFGGDQISFNDFFYDREIKKMSMEDFRSIFQRYILPDLFLNHIDYLFYHINQGTETDYINQLWKDMIFDEEKNPENYPMEINTHIINDEKDKKRYYMIISMPNLQKPTSGNLAIYFVVSFGSRKRDEVRYFLAETDYTHAILFSHLPYYAHRAIFIAEITQPYYDDNALHKNYGILFNEKGEIPCPDNELSLFVDHVIAICQADRKGFFKKRKIEPSAITKI